MTIIEGLERVKGLRNAALTVGNFDGVHLAHQRLLARARELARESDGRGVVLTFEPHPLTIVSPGNAPERLTRPEEKLDRLAEFGADVVVVARSDEALLGMEAEPFVRNVLIERFRPSHIVEGPSFGFGRGRRGNPDLLREVASGHGCLVHIVDPVTVRMDDGETVMVSSSLIRRLLTEGRVHEAGRCLGRPYAIIGEVIHGDGRGRGLGAPTANLRVEGQLLPADGVYAGNVVVEKRSYRSAISIGRTPTFGGGDRRIEAHLIGFDGDLYGRNIRVEVERRLRDQVRFDSPDALMKQVRRDIEAAGSNGVDRHDVGAFVEERPA